MPAYTYYLKTSTNLPTTTQVISSAKYDETEDSFGFHSGNRQVTPTSFSKDLKDIKNNEHFGNKYGLLFVQDNKNEFVCIYQFAFDDVESFNDIFQQHPVWMNKEYFKEFCNRDIGLEDGKPMAKQPENSIQDFSSSSESDNVNQDSASELDSDPDEILNLSSPQKLKNSLDILFLDRQSRVNEATKHNVLNQILESDDPKILQTAYEHEFFGRHRKDAKTREGINNLWQKMFAAPLIPTASQKLLKEKIDQITKDENKNKF